MNGQALALKERIRAAATVKAPLVAIAGGRPGAGATALVAALARALARRGVTALVVDRSGDPGDAALRLGLAPRVWLADEGAVEVGERLSVLRAPAAECGPARLRRLLAEVAPRGPVIVDCEGAGAEELFQQADLALVVATPDPATATGAYGLLKRLATVRGSLSSAAVVVNRAASPAEGERLARSLGELFRRFVGREVQAWPHDATRLAERVIGAVA